MARRINLSQFQSKLRQAQAKRRQAIAQYNQLVRRHNQAVRNLRVAIDRYNAGGRAYNSRRRTNLQRLRTELARLESRASSSHTEFRTSVVRLHSTYTRLESSASTRRLGPSENFFLDLAEREAANSVAVLNALDSPEESGEAPDELRQTAIGDEIAVISEELDARWRGALFSLHPANPEAARHFCTSAREIFVEILESKAPDQAVFSAIPDCPRTEQGKATRRSKIAYLLGTKGVTFGDLADFINEDITNVMDLFKLFNSGTHGTAGRFDLSALRAMKRRVEDGLLFLSRLAA